MGLVQLEWLARSGAWASGCSRVPEPACRTGLSSAARGHWVPLALQLEQQCKKPACPAAGNGRRCHHHLLPAGSLRAPSRVTEAIRARCRHCSRGHRIPAATGGNARASVKPCGSPGMGLKARPARPPDLATGMRVLWDLGGCQCTALCPVWRQGFTPVSPPWMLGTDGCWQWDWCSWEHPSSMCLP